MYGHDYVYAQTRIQGTVLRVLATGEPVYVVQVSGDGRCACVPIDLDWGDRNNNIYLQVDELDMHPVPLGYVNCAGEATYLMRVPMRRDWKQGLRQENCWSSGRRLLQIPMKDVKNCIMNRYPTLNKALEGTAVRILENGKASKLKTIAWHRHWAVNSARELLYKNHEVVGQFNKGLVPILDGSHTYLKEALQESMQ